MNASAFGPWARVVVCVPWFVASAWAQTGAPSVAEEPAVTVQPPRALQPLKAQYASVRADAVVGTTVSDMCYPAGGGRVIPGVLVVVVRAFECTPKYGSSKETLMEVLYRGRSLFVSQDGVYLSDADRRKVVERDAASVEDSRTAWVTDSKDAYHYQLKQAIKEVDATSKFGIALIESRIFDVSEYGEGTGFSVKFLNTGKKTIKYANFSILGLNAVKDPVRDRFSRDATVRLRGIGPVEPDRFASYSKDYMWMSDFVEYHRITQVKLEFMDGTSKTISDIKRIKVDSSVYDLLTDDSE